MWYIAHLNFNNSPLPWSPNGWNTLSLMVMIQAKNWNEAEHLPKTNTVERLPDAMLWSDYTPPNCDESDGQPTWNLFLKKVDFVNVS